MDRYKDYIKKLKKYELENIVNDYNSLCIIYSEEQIKVSNNKKELVESIDKVKNKYLEFLIKSLDYEDYIALKDLVKHWNNELLNKYKELVNYLKNKHIFFQKDNLEVPIDLDFNGLNNKLVIKYIKDWDNVYKMANGIIIAYGVISREYFSQLVNTLDNKELIVPKLEFYYKKEYMINEEMIVSNKLNNKKRINSYYKNDDYREFMKKDFILLGTSLYHHKIKSYKKFIKMLKNHYVFKKKDIDFVDKFIVIPFLYNSLNEEEIAYKNLEETVIKYFEFKGDKLKIKMLSEIKKIREDFPLWEYRGKTKNEVMK